MRVIDPTGALRGSYMVQVLAGEAAETQIGKLFGAVTNSAGGHYRDLLTAFARDAREQVLSGGLPGQRLVRRMSS